MQTTQTLLTLTVLYAPAVDGGYVVFCPALNSLATQQGETLDEAREIAKEAILGYLETLHEDGLPLPADREATAEELAELLGTPTKEEWTITLVPA